MSKFQTTETKAKFNIMPWVVAAIILSASALVLALIALLGNGRETVYVDSIKLISNYKGAKFAKEGYERKAAIWKANIDTLTIEFNKAVAKHQKEKAGMTERERKLSEELLVNKQQQLENYKQATSENANKEDQQITGKVVSEINDFLKRYGEEHNYEFIIAATTAGNIVYAKKDKDITDKVLEKLNANYQPAGK